MLTHLDLFTGIGGFHIAAEWAGFESVGFSEIEPYCCQLLSEKYPHIPNYGNITTTDFSGLRGTVTVLTAGVPCQPASLAGKGLGEKDDRWLWPQTLDVVEVVQPDWCIFENPTGIFRVDAFETILLRLEAASYEVAEPFQVSANSVGADHARDRVFFVAHLKSKRMEGSRSAGIKKPEIQIREILSGCGNARSLPSFRSTEPPILRAVDGIPNRSHRIKALGNSVVPAQAYPFLKAIYQIESDTQNLVQP